MIYLMIDNGEPTPVWSAPASVENYARAVSFARCNARSWVLLLETGNGNGIIQLARTRIAPRILDDTDNEGAS